MGIIKNDDIVGYSFQGKFVCTDCATDDDLKELKEDEVITSDDVEREEALYFCDECKKQIG